MGQAASQVNCCGASRKGVEQGPGGDWLFGSKPKDKRPELQAGQLVVSDAAYKGDLGQVRVTFIGATTGFCMP